MDITTIADLLNEFILTENEILKSHNIKHPTTIGSIYEGLTEDILKKSIFTGLNLKVIKNSFIFGCNTEFDVLLVEGEGERIPYTDRFQYNPEQVIAIIQVKKNLYSKDIEEGYNNLKFLIDYFKSAKPQKFVDKLFRDSFRLVCQKDITENSEKEFTENELFIYDSLLEEAKLPVRIIWGYNGFKSEFSFRESFYKYLEGTVNKNTENKITGFAPHNFPNLIICGKYSLIKLNGMPFCTPLNENNWWSFYSSSSYIPTNFFLEMIWTRLSYKYNLSSDIFGEDLIIEPINIFLDSHSKEYCGKLGWEYKYIFFNAKSLKSHSHIENWKPIEIDIAQHVIIAELCKYGEINLVTDKEFEKFVLANGYSSLAEFLERLIKTGLVFVENSILKLLTDVCRCAVLPSGKFVAGEDKSGRFTNWLMKEIAKSKVNKI